MRTPTSRGRIAWTRPALQGLALALAGPVAAAGARAPSCDFCGIGRNQSPVRLERPVDTALAGPTLAYVAETVQLRNTSTSTTSKNLQVDYPVPARSVLELDGPGDRYELREFHFHLPGEHAFGATGDPAAMEVHFVHQRGSAAAVLGVPIALGPSTHPLLRELFAAIPRPGERRAIPGFDATSLAFYEGIRLLRYSGSLTTGTCDEGLAWFVYDAVAPPVLTVSAEDLQRYRRAFPAAYFRPMQPLHARQILRVGPPSLAPSR